MRRSMWALVGITLLASSRSAAAGEPAGVLVVSVASEAGAPVAGAMAWAWNDGGEQWRATTDDRGSVRIADVAAGTVTLLVQAERFVGRLQDVEVEAGREVKVEVALYPGLPFDGTVLDEAGKPIENASVRVDPGGSFEGYMEGFPNRPPYAYARTDAQGRFRVPGIPPRGVATVVVSAEGYEAASAAVRGFGESVRPANLTIRMAPGSSISGTVKTPDGKPHAGATVLAIPADDEQLKKNPHIFHTSDEGMVRAAVAQADGEGRYVLHGLRVDREILVCAEAEGFARSPWSGPHKPTAAARQLRADLVLAPAATLVVRILTPGGSPRAADRVELDGPMSEFEAESTAVGVYRFTQVAPGEHRVDVEAKGFLRAQRTLVVEGGKAVDLEIALDPGVAIAGVVVDKAGKPVAGMTVRAERKENEEGWHDAMGAPADTDAEGRFAIAGLRPGRHALSLWSQEADLEAPVLAAAPTSGVRLVALWHGRVRLRLRTPNGEPLPSSVYVWREDPDGGGSGSGWKPRDGVLEFWLTKGRQKITIDVEGYVRVVRDVVAGRGEEVDVGTVTLDVGVSLRGRVIDVKGKPVPAAIVSHGASTATTGDDGQFVLEHVPKGKVSIRVQAEAFLAGLVEADAADAAGAVVTLLRGSLVEGVLRDASGTALERRTLQILRPGATAEAPWEEFDDVWLKAGAFRVRLPAGRYRFVLVDDTEKPLTLAEFEAVEGADRRLDLSTGK